MEELKYENDIKCPKVHFQPNGQLEITGKCIPDHPREYFASIISWMEEYLKNPSQKTTLNMKVIYCNSFSKKYFIVIFSMLKTLKDKGLDAEVNWYYEEGDDDMREIVELYKDGSEMEIKAISYDPNS